MQFCVPRPRPETQRPGGLRTGAFSSLIPEFPQGHTQGAQRHGVHGANLRRTVPVSKSWRQSSGLGARSEARRVDADLLGGQALGQVPPYPSRDEALDCRFVCPEVEDAEVWLKPA